MRVLFGKVVCMFLLYCLIFLFFSLSIFNKTFSNQDTLSLSLFETNHMWLTLKAVFCFMKFKYDITKSCICKDKSRAKIFGCLYSPLKWINTPTQHRSYVHSSNVSQLWRWLMRKASEHSQPNDTYLQPRSRFPLAHGQWCILWMMHCGMK